MQISKILKQEAVRVIGAASSKKRLFQEIAEVAQAAYGLSPTTTVAALLDRESLGPTGVGHGVALPALDGGGADAGQRVVLQLKQHKAPP